MSSATKGSSWSTTKNNTKYIYIYVHVYTYIYMCVHIYSYEYRNTPTGSFLSFLSLPVSYFLIFPQLKNPIFLRKLVNSRTNRFAKKICNSCKKMCVYVCLQDVCVKKGHSFFFILIQVGLSLSCASFFARQKETNQLV